MVYTRNMDMLSEILSSRTRSEIFRLLLGPEDLELHIREIQRRTGLNDSTIRQELRKLTRLELLTARKDSNRIYYKANKSNPLFTDLKKIVLKTTGLVDLLKEALQDKKISLAFVFGSFAEGNEKAESDVDLFVIGNLGLKKITELLSGVAEQVGREINPHTITSEEFQERLKTGDHFIKGIVTSPKLFIIGNENDFEAMGR
ncbi:DNA polymerase beta domain protein region [uncultured Desulfobacterium sp.]|uniref:DNA polymerase beta domain protein region n=1 Tax=uncultured Desulfobacterium sp. TaxID=201089 RepID=A0A445MZ91_9BACT|nr:DNA polymerase beta domain protein region [uncultured Desulfobacterium sp.]